MNISASFQGFINKILTVKYDIFLIIYLDNFLIYTVDDGNGHVIVYGGFWNNLGSICYMAN